MRAIIYMLFLSAFPVRAEAEFEEGIRAILERSCLKCHGGEKVKGKVDFSKIRTEADADARFELWETVVEMVGAGEMPPEDEPQLTEEEKKTILDWYEGRLAAPIKARPGVFRPRRLSGPEYRNTLRSLFGFDLEVAIATAQQTVAGEQSLVLKLLPKDPPGASGFVNDTHGAPLSPVIWEQYAFLTDSALEKFFAPKQRPQLEALMGEELPTDWKLSNLTQGQAEALVRRFLPRALRRRVPEVRLTAILAPLQGKSGPELLQALKFEMKAVLLSPEFLYRGLLMKGQPGIQQPVDAYELAERLSYFLWEDRPDDELMAAAESGSLLEGETIPVQVERMLKAPAARSLAESFGVQWLGIANLDELIKNPIAHHSLRTQPVLFLDYLFTENRPVMELIDSRTTFINTGVSGFYGADRGRMKLHPTPKGIERQTTPFERFTLEQATWRGGILTMPGILTMNRGPIQRGTWLLRRVLGERLGEPPADIPPVKPAPRGEKLTFRERFERHRSDVSCARCHEKIDPLGFSLDGYDVNGRFIHRNGKKGQGIDTSGKLPSGETFSDYAGLKKIFLTTQRERIVRNVVERTLSYALCRKLTRSDHPAIDQITEMIVESNGTWKDLFVEVVKSLPFRETIIEEPAKE